MLPVGSKGGEMRLRGLAYVSRRVFHGLAGRFWRVPRALGFKKSADDGPDWIDNYKGFGIILASRRTEIHSASYSVTRRHTDGSIEILALEQIAGTYVSEAQAKRAARFAARWLIDSIGAQNQS
jgi:hypothetical protein